MSAVLPRDGQCFTSNKWRQRQDAFKHQDCLKKWLSWCLYSRFWFCNLFFFFLRISQELSLLCIINTSHFSKYKNTEIFNIVRIRHLSRGSAQLECFNFTERFAGMSRSLLTLISVNHTDITKTIKSHRWCNKIYLSLCASVCFDACPVRNMHIWMCTCRCSHLLETNQ